MEKRQLGNSDVAITAIGLGTWAMGGGGWEFAWGPQADQDSIAPIHEALDQGINWIDTAAVYGLRHPEEVVARALAGRSTRPYVFTRCSMTWNHRGTIGHSLSAIRFAANVKRASAVYGWMQSISTRSIGRSRTARSRRVGRNWRVCSGKARCDGLACPIST